MMTVGTKIMGIDWWGGWACLRLLSRNMWESYFLAPVSLLAFEVAASSGVFLCMAFICF